MFGANGLPIEQEEGVECKEEEELLQTLESPCFYVEASPSPNRGRNEEITNFASLYKLKALLGIGAFGVVLLVTNRFSREESALKIINKTRLSAEAKEFLRHES